MTPAEVGELFERGLRAKLELRRMEERLQALASPAISSGIPQAIRGGKSDPTADAANAMTDLEQSMQETAEALERDVQMNERLSEGIRRGLGPRYGDIIEDRYCRALGWKQVAAINGMAIATVHRYKDTAFEWVASVGPTRAMEGVGNAEL